MVISQLLPACVTNTCITTVLYILCSPGALIAVLGVSTPSILLTLVYCGDAEGAWIGRSRVEGGRGGGRSRATFFISITMTALAFL